MKSEENRSGPRLLSLAIAGLSTSFPALTALCLCVAATGAPALACSIAFQPTLVTAPRHGATGIPTNAQLLLRLDALGVSALGEAQLELTAESGQQVEFTAKALDDNHGVILPDAELHPLTAYTLTVTAPRPGVGAEPFKGTLSFTTGEGPDAEAPSKPDPFLVHYRRTEDLDSCTASEVTCVPLPEGLVVEVVPIDGFGQRQDSYLVFGSLATRLKTVDPRTHLACLSLRARGFNGQYSEATEVCGDNFGVHTLTDERPECTADGLLIDGEPVDMKPPPREGGCTVAQASTERGLSAGLVLFALFSGVAAVRMRQRAVGKGRRRTH